MNVNNGLKNALFCIIVAVLITSSLLRGNGPISLASGQLEGDYIYYGVVPAKNYQLNLTDPEDRNSEWILDTRYGVSRSTLLSITAGQDNTNVEVYNLATSEQLAQGQLNSMQNLNVLLSNGTIFKVVANLPVTVLLLNYQGTPNPNPPAGILSIIPTPFTFYTSTDGLFVGREFVFMASELAAQDYIILALENADVTVTRDDGDQATYSLEVNSYRLLMLRPFRTYRIESTGSIMIQSGIIPGIGNVDNLGLVDSFFVPAAEGGFVGTTFYTRTATSWDIQRDYGFRISAVEDARVTVYSLETKEALQELTVSGGSGIAMLPAAPAIAVQSDRPITLTLVHNGSIEQTHPLAGHPGGTYSGYGRGVTFIGVRSNEDTPIYLPVDSQIEAYFFASEETEVTIDGFSRTIQGNTYYLYTQPGTHLINSDKDMIIQVNSWPREPENQGNRFSGALVPCAETISLVPDVALTPLGGGGFPITYIVIGVAAAAVAAIAGFFIMRSRSRKAS